MEAFNQLLEKLKIQKIMDRDLKILSDYTYLKDDKPLPDMNQLLEFTNKGILAYEKLIVIAIIDDKYQECANGWKEQLNLMKLIQELILNNKEIYSKPCQEDEGSKGRDDTAIAAEDAPTEDIKSRDEVHTTIESDFDTEENYDDSGNR